MKRLANGLVVFPAWIHTHVHTCMHTNNPGCQSVLKIHHSMETFLNSPVKLSPPLFLGSARCPIECLLLVLRSHPLSSLKSIEFTGGLLPSTRILLPPPPLSQPLLFLWLCLKEALPAHPVQGKPPSYYPIIQNLSPLTIFFETLRTTCNYSVHL